MLAKPVPALSLTPNLEEAFSHWWEQTPFPKPARENTQAVWATPAKKGGREGEGGKEREGERNTHTEESWIGKEQASATPGVKKSRDRLEHTEE